MENNELILHIEGDSAVSAKALSNILLNLTEIIQIAIDVEAPDNFEIKINSFKSGSFIIPFLISTAKLMLDNLDTVLTIFDIIQTSIDIKKQLKGKEPNKIIDNPDNTKTIQTYNADNIIVHNTTFNFLKGADKYISELAQHIYQNNPEQACSLMTVVKKQDLTIDDIKNMSIPIAFSNKHNNIEITDNLKIIKPVFSGDSMWTFHYKDRKINAKIIDKDFIEKVQEGQISFTANDFINATILYQYEDNALQSSQVVEKYIIKKVNNIFTQKYSNFVQGSLEEDSSEDQLH